MYMNIQHTLKTCKHNHFNIVHFHPQVLQISRFVCGRTVFAVKEQDWRDHTASACGWKGRCFKTRQDRTHQHDRAATVSCSVVVEVTFAVAAGLHVGAQFVHAVERVQEERSYGVDLHQSQVVQLRRKRSRKGVFGNIFALLAPEDKLSWRREKRRPEKRK